MIMDLQKRKELKKKLYTIIFKTDTEEGKRFDIILLNVILLSVILAAIESVVAFNARYALPFRICEWIITILFTIEYATRIYCSPNRKKYILYQIWLKILHQKKKYLLYVLSFYVGLLLPAFCLANIRSVDRVFYFTTFHGMKNTVQIPSTNASVNPKICRRFRQPVKSFFSAS